MVHGYELNYDHIVIGSQESTDDSGSVQSLLDIEVRRRLVEHVDIGFLNPHQANGEPLQFSSRKLVNIAIQDMFQFQNIKDIIIIVHLETSFQQTLNGLISSSFQGLRYLVDILRLDNRFQIVFKYLREVVLQFRAAEVLKDLL